MRYKTGEGGQRQGLGDGESHICQYRDLGFYPKLGNHPVLSRKVTWTGLFFQRIWPLS